MERKKNMRKVNKMRTSGKASTSRGLIARDPIIKKITIKKKKKSK
jgi:hypothetical protein